MDINECYCTIDIETWTPTGKVDPESDELRYIGFKDGKTGRKTCLHYTEKEKIQNIINYYDYFVGHNILNYDIPVLKRHGFIFTKTAYLNYKVMIDTYQIMERRAKSMLYIDLLQGEKSLSSLCERFGLESQKGQFDYSLLKEESLDGEVYNDLVKYLYGDLDADDDLFKHLYELFYGIREFMSPKDQSALAWLTASAGTTAYKCICNMAGLPQEYDNDAEMAGRNYEGAFVSEPYVDKIGDI